MNRRLACDIRGFRRLDNHRFTVHAKTLREIYTRIDNACAALSEIHAERLTCCRGCSSCCQDDLTVFEVEAENIRHHYADLLSTEAPYEPGACAFLDAEGACRIYAHRPYVCRTQGLPLRWLEEQDSGETVEYRDICPLNDHGEPIEDLPAEDCWTLGPAEEALAELQERFRPGNMTRIPLRSLFR